MRKFLTLRQPIIEGAQEIRVLTNAEEVKADIDTVIEKVKQLKVALDELKKSLDELGQSTFNVGISVDQP